MNPILKAVKESTKLLDLKIGWDDDLAEPVSISCFQRTIEFLIELHHYLNMNQLSIDWVIDEPRIEPMIDGHIGIYFRRSKNKHSISICIYPDSISWFGDDLQGNNIIKHKQVEIYNKELFMWINQNIGYE